ncbi:hypothetical protein MRB53_008042 [Persea americana]|uniref:Uncharacterized protein n=1 Tax=Persea americana TaxID=3435 RepID=A0ACC2MKY0_PERAE|nr:hypothetical protein MRB53_008042 [Persea americana]
MQYQNRPKSKWAGSVQALNPSLISRFGFFSRGSRFFKICRGKDYKPWRAMNLPVRLHVTLIAISSSLYLSFCKSSSSMATVRS